MENLWCSRRYLKAEVLFHCCTCLRFSSSCNGFYFNIFLLGSNSSCSTLETTDLGTSEGETNFLNSSTVGRKGKEFSLHTRKTVILTAAEASRLSCASCRPRLCCIDMYCPAAGFRVAETACQFSAGLRALCLVTLKPCQMFWIQNFVSRPIKWSGQRKQRSREQNIHKRIFKKNEKRKKPQLQEDQQRK